MVKFWQSQVKTNAQPKEAANRGQTRPKEVCQWRPKEASQGKRKVATQARPRVANFGGATSGFHSIMMF